MTYCQRGEKATLYYTSSKQQKVVTFNDTPIAVSINVAGTTCWRFYGLNSFGAQQELFAFGSSPGFEVTGTIAYPTLSGVIQNPLSGGGGSIYFLAPYGYGAAQNSTPTLTPGNTFGSCPSARNPTFQIQVTGNSGIAWNDQIDNANAYTVVCGSNCPSGYLKCSCNNYPGYCCVDCAPIENKIDSMTQQVKRLIPNVG